MTWGPNVKSMWWRAGAIVIGAAVVAGCQPSLNSELPRGPAAYDVIRDPVDVTPTAYFLRPGDKLAINIFQEEDLSQRELQIDEAGMISLPLVGEVEAAGLSTGQLSRAIETAYAGRYLRDPQANVVILQASKRTVAVEGQVVMPGVYEIQPGYTLLSALALARSPSPDAKLNEVLVFRTVNGERLGGRFDLVEIRAGRMPDPIILPGDVVVVGFSALRGIYRDILQAAPLLGGFAALNNSTN